MILPQAGQSALVYGAGATGIAAVRWLLQRGVTVYLHDDQAVRSPLLRDTESDYSGETETRVHYSHGDLTLDLQKMDWVIPSPGVALSGRPEFAILRKQGKLLGDVELFARLCDLPVIAVTGSNGKSTVVSMLEQCLTQIGLRVGLAGNIGLPVLALDLTDLDVVVLELSSFQLELCDSLKASVACILNISEDHMDRYPDHNAYIQAKQRIYRGAKVCLGWAEDLATYPMASESSVLLGKNSDVQIKEQAIYLDGKRWIDKLAVAGDFNVINAAFAAEICLRFIAGRGTAVTRESMTTSIAEALHAFTALPHRCAVVAEKAGVVYINDSKGTNVGATVAALQGMSRPVVLIAGGDGKGADFSPLKESLQRIGRMAILIGRDAEIISCAIDNVVPAVRCVTLLEAVSMAASVAKSGDIVLLSPACASWDMFDNYMARGAAFVAAVEAL